MKKRVTTQLMFLLALSGIIPGCNSGADQKASGSGEWMGEAASNRPDGGAPTGLERGAEVYFEYCAACHGEDGSGIGSIYPPLADADFLLDRDKTVSAVVNGLQGPISVNGREFNGVMAPLPAAYDDATAAEVINFVVERFSSGEWQVTAEEVSEIRD